MYGFSLHNLEDPPTQKGGELLPISSPLSKGQIGPFTELISEDTLQNQISPDSLALQKFTTLHEPKRPRVIKDVQNTPLFHKDPCLSDEVLAFTPTKSNNLSDLSSSPSRMEVQILSSIHSEASPPLDSPTYRQNHLSNMMSPVSVTPISTHMPPTILTPGLPSETDQGVAYLAVEQQSSRYSFRKRNAAQLAPYTADLIQYKRALRSNPDAIVRIRQIERQIQQQQQHRHPDDRYAEEEEEDYTNALTAAENTNWEEHEKRRRKTTEKEKEELLQYPEILRDLSTDDEEKEMDVASRQARKILRAKEKQRKAREREQIQQRNKKKKRGEKGREMEYRLQPYPLSKPEPMRDTPQSAVRFLLYFRKVLTVLVW